jgi:hypothetical protein
MIRVVGQALWVVETAAGRIDPYAPFALSVLFQQLKDGAIEFETHPDILFGERGKAEALIGPPPCREPLATYANWYRSRIEAIDRRNGVMHSAHGAVTFEPPDVSVRREYIIDLYAELPLKGGQSKPEPELLWIDLTRVRPSKPQPRNILQV